MATRLARAGASLEVADLEGRTALHLAAGCGDAAMVAHLLHLGADVNATDSVGGEASFKVRVRIRVASRVGIAKVAHLPHPGDDVDAADSVGGESQPDSPRSVPALPGDMADDALS